MLAATHRRVRVRVPLVPGLTDADDNVEAVGHLLSSLDLRDVDLLPYHRAGLAKYDRLGFETTPADLPVPTGEAIAHAARLLRGCGLKVRIGG